MRFEMRRLTDYTDQAILDEVRRVAALVNEPTLSKSTFREHSRVSPTTIERRFGTWKKGLAAAGLSERSDSSNSPVAEEQVLSELRRVAQLLGTDRFSRAEFDAHARFKGDVVRRRFGTWHKAMRAAGLQTTSLGKRYTDEECYENLLSVWTHYGRAPTHDEMATAPSVVGPKAYIRRFGTWNRTLQAFVDRVNADNADGPEDTSKARHTTANVRVSMPESEKREIRLGLRYAVLSRDCFRCVGCGRSPATHLGVVLHVDHKIPFSKGGKTVFENLRTLCEDCNLGRGNRHEA